MADVGRSQVAKALEAAKTWRFCVHQLLGTTRCTEAFLAQEVQGALWEAQGFHKRAWMLYKKILMEAEPLWNAWDEEDFFVPYLKQHIAQLSQRPVSYEIRTSSTSR